MAARHSRAFYRNLGKFKDLGEKQASRSWIPETAKKLFNSSNVDKYGLLYDDTLTLYPIVQQAAKRLPKDLEDGRNFRIARALQLSLSQQVLSKEERTKFEDIGHDYLQPYILHMEEEQVEKDEWAKYA